MSSKVGVMNKVDLMKQATSILKSAGFDCVTAEKKDRQYRRKKRREARQALRRRRERVRKFGKLGPASPVRQIAP